MGDPGAIQGSVSTTSGDFNRVVGHLFATGSTANSNTGQVIMYFNPSQVWVEVS